MHTTSNINLLFRKMRAYPLFPQTKRVCRSKCIFSHKLAHLQRSDKMSLLRRQRPATTSSGGGCAPQFKPFVLPVKSTARLHSKSSNEDDDDAARNRKALVSGMDLALKRLPFLSFLSVPPEVTTHKLRQQFKSPGAARSSESDRLLQVKTLGMRRRWGAFVLKDPVRHTLPPLVVADEDDDVADAEALPTLAAAPAATGAADAPPPLVLWQSDDDPTWQVVVPEIVGKFLRPHQREGVQFLFDCVAPIRAYDGMGCILADDMGLGKTLQSIALLYTLFTTSLAPDRQPTVKRAIVVCPTSLVKNWDDEIVKWLHGRVKTTALFEANRDAVVQGIRTFIDGSNHPRLHSPQVLVISYETFRMHAQRFIDAPKACDLLICDEAHRLKNASSQINRALSALACRRRVLLSGTPMQNDLDEFFAMVDFTNPGILGSASEFRKHFLGPILVGREPDATDRARDTAAICSAKLCEVVNQFILRRGNILNAKHLPPKLMQVVCCPLSPLQEQLYAHFLSSSAFRDMMKKQNANVLASITALKKLCNHPLLIFDETGRSNTKLPGFDNCAHFFAQALQGGASSSSAINRRGGPQQRTCHPAWSGKMLLLDRLMQSMKSTTTDRIVIVSNYTQTLDVVSDLCRERHLPFVRLDGTTSAKKRKALVDTFNDPTTHSFAFLLSSKAGGCGLNLIGANRLVLFDPDWNPATDKQAAARVWREGQKKMCYVYRFLATGTLEEKIFQRQLSKEGLQNIVDDKEEVNSLSSKDLKRLFVFERGTMSTTHDQLKCTRCKWRNRSLKAIDGDADAVLTVDTTDESDGDVSVATEKDASGDDDDGSGECVAEKTYHPQIGMPQEEDLNSWGHHRSYDSVDDEVMQNALKHVRADLVSFAFSCRIDWQLLQEHQAENEEREIQRDEERKRKRLEKLEAEKAPLAEKARTARGKKKTPTVIDDEESDNVSGSSSEEEEEEEEEEEDDGGRRSHPGPKRQMSEDDTTTDDVAESESEIEIIDVDAPAPQLPVPSAANESSPAANEDATQKRKVSFIQDTRLETSSARPSGTASTATATATKRLKRMQTEDDFDDILPTVTTKVAPPVRTSTSSFIIDEDEKESEPPAASRVAAPAAAERAKSGLDDDAWSCSRCTLENPLANNTCSGCGLRFRRSRRPAAHVFDWNSGDDDDF